MLEGEPGNDTRVFDRAFLLADVTKFLEDLGNARKAIRTLVPPGAVARATIELLVEAEKH